MPLVDIFECLYRFRFTNDAGQQIDEAVSHCSMDVVRYVIVSWGAAVVECSKPQDTPVKKAYFGRLAVACGRTMDRAAKSLGWECEDLVTALGELEKGKTVGGIADLAQRAVERAKQELDTGLTEVPAVDSWNWKLFLNSTVAVLSATLVGMFEAEIERFVLKAVEYAKGVVMRTGKEDGRIKLLKSQRRFLKDLLYFLDAARYDDIFQYVYCVWGYGLENSGA
jgi:hypothetical protein